ncbi:hypothetical protein CK203_083350 [Vitis vinifera]|uniref:Uncharacterized protein n=1 Tax=Vitis vinifera TaxID=29760 RepID=A0A438BWC7_VITVI|nr:hypothetical protein CK203_083350 [Vitis vinifera]
MLGLWQDLDLNCEEEWECTGDSVRFKKKVENKRVFEFLAGLNCELDDVRSRDLSSGKTIGSAKEREVLYYFDETDVHGQCPPTVCNSASRPKDRELLVKGENLILSSFPVSSIPGNLPVTVFHSGHLPHLPKLSEERLEEISNFPKAPEPENSPRAGHAHFYGRQLNLTRRRVRAHEAFSGDAPPPLASPDADQPPYIPSSPIRALHVPLLGIFVSVGPPNSLSSEAPATFSPPQSLHVPWEVFFYLFGGTTPRSKAVSLFRWCHAAT